MEKYLLLGVIPGRFPPHSGVYGDGWLFALSATDQRIALFEGASAHFQSAIKDLNSWFLFQPRYVMNQGGKSVLVTESPGWFESRLQEAGCGWFLPIAARIASEGRIPLEDIVASYALNNAGQAMAFGSIDQIFEQAKQRGLLK